MEQRRVALVGVYNCRDLGGLATRDGKRLKLGRAFRSDTIHHLDERDAATLSGLGIRKVLDLRSDSEVRKDNSLTIRGADRVHIPLVAATLSPFDPDVDWSSIDLRQRYLEMLSVGGSAIRTVLEAAASDAPILFHCTAGKDRTGVVAAVLLRALDVEDDAIVEDYALSEASLRAFLSRLREDLVARRMRPEAVEYLTSSPPARMRFMLGELDRRWGSTEDYLRWIGVGEETVERLKVSLLC